MMMTEAHVGEVVSACAEAVEAISLSPGPPHSSQIFPEEVEQKSQPGALPCIFLDAEDGVVESGELRWPPSLALSLAASSDLHQSPGSSPDPGLSATGRVEKMASRSAAGFSREESSAASPDLELEIDIDMNSAAAKVGSSHGPEIVVSSLDPAEPAESGELRWPPAHLMVKYEDDDDTDDGGDDEAVDDGFTQDVMGRSRDDEGRGVDDGDDDDDDDMKEVPDDRDDTAAVSSMEPDEESHVTRGLVDPRGCGAERAGHFGESAAREEARGMEACVSMEEEEEEEEEEEQEEAVEFEEEEARDEEEVEQDEGDDYDEEQEGGDCGL